MNACIKHVLVAFTIAVVVGCTGPEFGETITLPDAEPYRLDSGDQLNITVFGQEQMTGEYLIDGGGFVSMPLIGQVAARGGTAQELEQAIATNLRERKVVLNPSVNVQILTYRPFFILGEVTQPGQFPFIENMTVLTAVAMAGGFTYRADVNGFTITRKIGNKIIEARAGRSSLIQPGDVIYVDERLF